MESAEQTTPREYRTLDSTEKVRAILGAVMEPVTKQFAVELSGIDYQGLEEEQKAGVDSVFTREDMEISEQSGETKYRLGDEAREVLGKSVDMKTVHGAIADKLWGDLGLDEIVNK